jgi:hypothetical protein
MFVSYLTLQSTSIGSHQPSHFCSLYETFSYLLKHHWYTAIEQRLCNRKRGKWNNEELQNWYCHNFIRASSTHLSAEKRNAYKSYPEGVNTRPRVRVSGTCKDTCENVQRGGHVAILVFSCRLLTECVLWANVVCVTEWKNCTLCRQREIRREIEGKIRKWKDRWEERE